MNNYQKSINQRCKYLMTIFCDKSYYKLRKRVRIERKNWEKRGIKNAL